MQINEKDFLSFITVKQGLDGNSIKLCLVRLRVIQRWLVERELTRQLVEEFFLALKNKSLKNNTLNTYYFTIRQIKAYCEDRKLPHDFLDGFKSFKKEKPDIIVLTDEEIEKIINTKLTYGKLAGKDCSFLDFRYRTLTMFLAHTGCRFGEASSLKLKNLDLSAGRATFVDTKTNENRTNYIFEPLKSNLAKLVEGIGPEDFVFRNSKEKQVHPQDYIDDLKKRAKQAGIIKRVYPHIFRHSYITHMLEAGVPITEVASLVGHKDIQTTFSTYMHLADQTLRKASMRNPLISKTVDPVEILKALKEVIEGFHLEQDSRFKYKLIIGKNGSIEFKAELF